MQQSLLLLSGSKGRQQLLKDANIPYHIITHNSDENIDPTGLTPEQLVCAIAKAKMESVHIPADFQGQQVFALAADTLVFTQDGEILSKPTSKQNAVEMLTKLAQAPAKVISGCCLRIYQHCPQAKTWKVENEKLFAEHTTVLYAMPTKYFEQYFRIVPASMEICSSADVEGFGAQFTKWMSGSYTNIQGLPMFEVREALEELGFKFS